MSRKATDLSGEKLTFGQKANKAFTKDLPRWFYNKETGTILGPKRGPKEFGKLMAYYLGFYALISGYFAICYAVMTQSLPLTPDNIYLCNSDRTPFLPFYCHDGPRFKALPVDQLWDGDSVVEQLSIGLIDPTLSSFPSNLFVSSNSESISPQLIDKTNYLPFTHASAQRLFNYGHPLKEAKITGCDTSDPDVKLANEQNFPCDASLIDRVFPTGLIPMFDNTTKSFKTSSFQNSSFFTSLDDKLMEPIENVYGGFDYRRPKAYASPVFNGTQFRTYLVFLRLNKLWNYVPANQYTIDTTRTPPQQSVNDIGIKCYFVDRPCGNNDKGKNYKGEDVSCDTSNAASGLSQHKDSGTLSAGGAMKIDMINNVMSKPSGFPWKGGLYDLQFASLLLTWNTTKDLSSKGQVSKSGAPVVRCEWGIETTGGVNAQGVQINTTKAVNRERRQFASVKVVPTEPVADFFVMQLD